MIYDALNLLLSIGKNWLPISLVFFYSVTVHRYFRYIVFVLKHWRYFINSLLYIPYVQYCTSFIGSCALLYFGNILCYSGNKLLPLVFSLLISLVFIIPVKFFELELQIQSINYGKYFDIFRKITICIVFVSLFDSMLLNTMLTSFLESFGVANVSGVVNFATPTIVLIISVLGFLRIGDLLAFLPICFVFLAMACMCIFVFLKLLVSGKLRYLFVLDRYDRRSIIKAFMMGFLIATQTSDCFSATNTTVIAYYRDKLRSSHQTGTNNLKVNNLEYSNLTYNDRLSINCFSLTLVLSTINAFLAPCLIALSLFVICSGKGDNILDLYLFMPKVMGYVYRLCVLVVSISIQFSIQFYLASLIRELFNNERIYAQMILMSVLVLVQLIIPIFLNSYYVGSLLMGSYAISQALYSIYMLYIALTSPKNDENSRF